MRKLPDPLQQRLFVDWVVKLCSDRLGVKQTGSGSDPQGQASWNITLPDDTTVTIKFTGRKSVVVTDCSKDYRTIITEVEREAYRLTTLLDYGDGTWWHTSFSTDIGVIGFTGIHSMRILNEHRRYQGFWRIGNDALLEFSHQETGTVPIVIPKFDLTITFRVPSPSHGPFGQYLAEQMGTFIRSIAAFVSGSPIQHGGMLFPADDEAKTLAVNKLGSGEVGELYLDDVVLWPQLISLVSGFDNVEALRRAQGAIYSYEQALLQESEFVSIVLFVTSIEALAVPNAPWHRTQLTKRFVEFVMVSCPEAVDDTMRHANSQQAFGATISPTRFLENVYDLRSRPLHTGMTPHIVSNFGRMGQESSIRVSLLSQLARAVILSFLRAPSSSLVGHPGFETDAAPKNAIATIPGNNENESN